MPSPRACLNCEIDSEPLGKSGLCQSCEQSEDSAKPVADVSGFRLIDVTLLAVTGLAIAIVILSTNDKLRAAWELHEGIADVIALLESFLILIVVSGGHFLLCLFVLLHQSGRPGAPAKRTCMIASLLGLVSLSPMLFFVVSIAWGIWLAG